MGVIPTAGIYANRIITFLFLRFMGDAERVTENIQTLMTPSERQRLRWLAEQEQRTMSAMVRILILDSLKIWEESNPGRKRRLK